MGSNAGIPKRRNQKRLLAEAGYLPVQYVARVLGVAHTTVSRWADSGRIPERRVGAARYVQLRGLRDEIGEDVADRAKLTFLFLRDVANGKELL
jgi:predicted transcriptional regulator